jgi:hypothetical protein
LGIASDTRGVKSATSDPVIEARVEALASRIQGALTERRKTGKSGAFEEVDLSDLSVPGFSQVLASGEIQVTVLLTDFSKSHVLDLEAAGMKVDHAVAKLKKVQGWVGHDILGRLASLLFVEKIGLPSYAFRRIGSVTSEGDLLHRAYDVRQLGSPGPFDGTGIKVGIISDGADSATDSVTSGDLPLGGITVHPTFSGSGDEGTAMAEIVHDLAPGADLYFAGPSTSLDMVAIIDWMANTANCDVICDDLGFYGQPFFADGEIAEEARAAVTNSGRVYVTSAGNDAVNHYQGAFDKPFMGSTINGNPLHDFKTGFGQDQFLDFIVPAGRNFVAILQWNEEMGMASQNFDLYLVAGDPLGIVAGSTLVQDGNDDPFEFFSIINTATQNIQVSFSIAFAGIGTPTNQLELFVLSGPQSVDDDSTSSDTIFGHPAVEEVISCAAINASDPGTDTIAFYSSRGPSTISFPTSDSRQTPFITGIDGVSITGAGGFPDPFFGTSAASPHIAALCALILDRDPNLEPSQVRDLLADYALDRGAAGFDNTYGNGLADVLASIESTIPTPTPTASPTETATETSTPSPTPTETSTPTPTQSPTSTSTSTPTLTPTPTNTATPTPTENPALVVWVDFAFGGVSNGSFANPYSTLAQAVAGIPVGGIMKFKGDSLITATPETPRITKPMQLRSIGGMTRLGVGPSKRLAWR